MGSLWVSTFQRLKVFLNFLCVYLIVFLAAGVAFTKNLIHLYAYLGSNDLRRHLEVKVIKLIFRIDQDSLVCNCCLTCISFSFQIDAHVGGVNDLAFDHRNKELCVVTCGDDKLIKVQLEFITRLDLHYKISNLIW